MEVLVRVVVVDKGCHLRFDESFFLDLTVSLYLVVVVLSCRGTTALGLLLVSASLSLTPFVRSFVYLLSSPSRRTLRISIFLSPSSPNRSKLPLSISFAPALANLVTSGSRFCILVTPHTILACLSELRVLNWHGLLWIFATTAVTAKLRRQWLRKKCCVQFYS